MFLRRNNGRTKGRARTTRRTYSFETVVSGYEQSTRKDRTEKTLRRSVPRILYLKSTMTGVAGRPKYADLQALVGNRGDKRQTTLIVEHERGVHIFDREYLELFTVRLA
jgi:hypothetical protein